MGLSKTNLTEAFANASDRFLPNRSASSRVNWIRACFLFAVSVSSFCARVLAQQPCGTMISSNNRIEVCDQGQFRLEILWPSLSSASGFTVMIDDSPSFNQPILRTHTSRKYLELKGLDSGLAPGITYYIKINPSGTRSQFRYSEGAWRESNLDYAYLRKAWEVSGRHWLGHYSGVNWNEHAKHWELDKAWPSVNLVGADAYYLEYALRAADSMAQACHDRSLVDELVNFLMTYTPYFKTLGELRRMKSNRLATYPLVNQGGDSERTIPWTEKTSGGDRLRDCQLCNAQFFHPVARLIRIITLLPASERSSEMTRFVNFYAPLIVSDHLNRMLFEADWDYWGAKELPKHLVDIWQAILNSSIRPQKSYQHAMLDRDLWLIATAAEMLGANANDPQAVPISDYNLGRLKLAIQTGVRLFQSKQTFHPETANFRGEIVHSTVYFSGDMDDQDEMLYSGYTGASFPQASQKKRRPGTSWDISHYYRVPVFLRAMYDNRKATGLDFPSSHDLEMTVNQYMHKAFQGNFQYPLFNNFADGSNGWFRVGYTGSPQFGYPPAAECDSAPTSKNPCLTTGAVMGWGLISFVNPDLAQLQHALLQLAASQSAESKSFRDRYYQWDVTFSLTDSHGQPQYPFLVLQILAGSPDGFRGCPINP